MSMLYVQRHRAYIPTKCTNEPWPPLFYRFVAPKSDRFFFSISKSVSLVRSKSYRFGHASRLRKSLETNAYLIYFIPFASTWNIKL